ncbi:hypothetical protein OUZ56_004305 [Daphnia magna]|uniref:GMP synthase n=1 Tax=Daphnia magna TaxID=35525 RepID=A0ABQ9YPF2_9CRUS|nr:hypothetical protein OUZ56_004305 [Daphnia magna]
MVRQLRIYGRVVEPLKGNCVVASYKGLGRELGLSTELLERHPFPGPGLSIQISYAEELFMEADFVETQVLIRLMVDYANMAAKRNQYVATPLPIRIVGVKGDCRTSSYCVELSSEHTQPNWNDLATYARLIQRVCHNVVFATY